MARVLLHLPHASRHIPLDERAGLAVDDAELARQHLALVDDRTGELFAPVLPGVAVVASPVSRLLVDVERMRDDALEPAAEVGMGAVYTRGVGDVVLRPALTADERERLLRLWYDPHHARLDRRVGKALAADGACVLVDAHSYPRDPLPTEIPGARRPEIGIGADKEWSRGVDQLAARHFQEAGYEVAIDQPYRGSMVPGAVRRNPWAHPGRASGPLAESPGRGGFRTVMIEVRRDVYLEPDTHLPGPLFNHLQATINALYARLGSVNFRAGEPLDGFR